MAPHAEPVIAVMSPASPAARYVLRAYYSDHWFEKPLPFRTGKGRPPVR
jgi:hypothetical protein